MIREIPHSLEAEKSILGELMLSKEIALEVFDCLKPSDFYEEKHKILFKVFRELDKQEAAIDIITITNYLEQNKLTERVGGIEYIASLLDVIPILGNAQYHIKIVKDHSMLRQLIEASKDNIEDAFSGQLAGAVLDKAEQRVMGISNDLSVADFETMDDLSEEGLKMLEQIHDMKGFVSGLSTGFGDLDTILAGLHGGELIILAARPGIGKTSLALNIASHIAKEETIAFFSMEMSSKMLYRRMICAEAMIGERSIMQGCLSKERWQELRDARQRLSSYKFFINDTPALTSQELRSKVRALNRKHKLSAVFVDYLQLMRGHDRTENRQQEITKISSDLKSLAKELDIPIIALSQLSRKVTQRGGPPRLSDLRESGALEQDADVVLFLYDPHFGTEEDREGSSRFRDIILKVGKQRNGPIGNVYFEFEVATTKFHIQEMHNE